MTSWLRATELTGGVEPAAVEAEGSDADERIGERVADEAKDVTVDWAEGGLMLSEGSSFVGGSSPRSSASCSFSARTSSKMSMASWRSLLLQENISIKHNSSE